VYPIALISKCKVSHTRLVDILMRFPCQFLINIVCCVPIFLALHGGTEALIGREKKRTFMFINIFFGMAFLFSPKKVY
jgi:hypothetical protein